MGARMEREDDWWVVGGWGDGACFGGGGRRGGEIGLALLVGCGPAFPSGYRGPLLPVVLGPPWVLGVGMEGIRCADAAGGVGRLL